MHVINSEHKHLLFKLHWNSAMLPPLDYQIWSLKIIFENVQSLLYIVNVYALSIQIFYIMN